MRLVEPWDVLSCVATPLLLLGISDTVSSSIRLGLTHERHVHTVQSVCCVSMCSVCVCVELIVSSLYCLHSVYAILILSIPICKNVLSFVSFSLLLSLESELERGSREVMAYTIECCWGKPLSKYVYTCSIYIYNIVCTCFRESVLRLLAVSRNSSKELKE